MIKEAVTFWKKIFGKSHQTIIITIFQQFFQFYQTRNLEIFKLESYET